MDYLLRADDAITDYFSAMVNGRSDLFRLIAKIMEWTMHGVPWLIGVLLFIFITDNPVAAHFLINLFLALLLDLVTVGLLKVAVRRPRPRGNPGHMIAEAPYVDQFSFPSGHTTRAAMLTKLLITLTAMDAKMKSIVCCFPIALGLSRVVLGRHYFSDVLAGLLIGLVECDVVTYYWLPPDTCLKFWRFIRREPYQ